MKKFYSFCLLLIFCEAATKIGLGNGRPSEEPSSLRTEVMKYKTSECGGSSSEEQTHKRRKQGNRRKNGSDEDEDDEDDDESEENNKRRNKNNGRRNNRERNKHKGREDMIGYGFTSYDNNNNRNFGQDDYMNRRREPANNPYQYGWNDQNPYNTNTQTRNRNTPYNPYTPSNDEFYYHNQPYVPPRSYNNRGGYPSQDEGHFHNNRDKDDGYSNTDDRNNSNRRNNNKHNDNWNNNSGEEEDESRNNGGRNGQRRRNNKHGDRRDKNRRNKDDSSEDECISQCVFNNMNIMEDDGIPSEGSMIQWAQEKISNERLRQAAVREIRKCFGTLASSDGENSCYFSKSLSKCLKLNLDDDE